MFNYTNDKSNPPLESSQYLM